MQSKGPAKREASDPRIGLVLTGLVVVGPHDARGGDEPSDLVPNLISVEDRELGTTVDDVFTTE